MLELCPCLHSSSCIILQDVWDAEQYNYKIVPKADEVGVHAGFMDLYTRPVPQPGLSNGEGPPPRQVPGTGFN